jgi:hypothetical protein
MVNKYKKNPQKNTKVKKCYSDSKFIKQKVIFLSLEKCYFPFLNTAFFY